MYSPCQGRIRRQGKRIRGAECLGDAQVPHRGSHVDREGKNGARGHPHRGLAEVERLCGHNVAGRGEEGVGITSGSVSDVVRRTSTWPYSTISTTPRPTPLICMLLAPWLAVVSVRFHRALPWPWVKVRAKVQDRPARGSPAVVSCCRHAKSPVTARVMAPVSCGLFGSFLTEQARVEVLPTTWSSKSSDFPVLQLVVLHRSQSKPRGDQERCRPRSGPAGVEAVRP